MIREGIDIPVSPRAVEQSEVSPPDGSGSNRLQSLLRGQRLEDEQAHPAPRFTPETQQQRADFAATALGIWANELPGWCFTELRRQREASLPTDISQEARSQAMSLINDIAQYDYAYRLELHEAIKNEIATADLSRSVRPLGTRGHEGTLSVGVSNAGVWGVANGIATANYYVDFDKYPRVGAAADALQSLERQLAELTGHQ